MSLNIFLIGESDKVICFQCNGGLKGWDPEDDPIEEHIKWFSDCEYVSSIKGNHVSNNKSNTSSGYCSDDSDPPSSLEMEFEEPKVLSSEDKEETNSLKLENDRLKQERLCKICVEKDIGVVFVPCGHYVTCLYCAPVFDSCPMCRTQVKQFIRAFMS